MSRRFEYVTDWRFDAPIEAVWQALTDVERWPAWWPHVKEVRTLAAGDADDRGALRRIRWGSRLPYGFTLAVRTVEVEPLARLRGAATGDLAGTGLWELWRDGAGTRLRYTWNLAVHTAWMRLAAPLMAPVFRWNHEGVMRDGMRGLERHLARPARRDGDRTGSAESPTLCLASDESRAA
jgi:uncharacterized protein YndB with AHSA1/START domain